MSAGIAAGVSAGLVLAAVLGGCGPPSNANGGRPGGASSANSSGGTDQTAPRAGEPPPGGDQSGAAPSARTGGQPTGRAPNLVSAPAGTEVLIGQHPIGANLPSGMYTCARCHMVPAPDVLPRDRWPGMLTRMNQLITQYHLGEALTDQQLAEVIEYYTSRSSMALSTLPVEAGPPGRTAPISWQQGPVGVQEEPEPGQPFGPVIAGVTVGDLDRNGRADVLLSDAKNNVVTWFREVGDGWAEQAIANVACPSRTAVADLDADGDPDLLVASLGSLQPTDDLAGSLVALMNEGTAALRSVTLLRDEPRVCDVRPVDMDADGDLDLAFASFGLFHTGRAGWLEQTAPMVFTAHELLKSNGISHCPTGDVNGDGRPDVVVLVSQQHEKVMLYVNQGRSESGADVAFKEVELWRAPHPLWGNSSADLIDLDQDGDLDVVFTNGDALDGEPYSKPWHGVQWLENKSEGEAIAFEYRKIGGFHGAYWADAGDFDGDGDLDVIATSMMNQWQDPRRQAIVWFENDGQEGFTLWPVNIGPTYQVVGDIGDLDGDGKPDAVTGGMYVYQPFFRVSRAQVFMPRAAGTVAAPGP